MENKDIYGQYFTPKNIVDKMINLIQNTGSILEPSCGDGAFLLNLPADRATGVEIDNSVACKNAIIMDYFDYNVKADTIIGNPPYVRNKNIQQSTKEKLNNNYDNRTNLYIYFIDHSIDLLNADGELIFIVPRDFIKTTSAFPLNKRLFYEGGFTYWEEFGDLKVFSDASPNVVIFRWVKGSNHLIPVEFNNGYLTFNNTNFQKKTPINSLFTVMVGGASGANTIFINEKFGNIDLVVSNTKSSGQTKKAVYVEEPTDYLMNYKTDLMNRKIKTFNENNWWEWGRKIRHIDGEKIYVNSRTRDLSPFFTNNSGWFDGSILALVPKKNNTIPIEDWIDILNNTNWEEQGFLVGGRLIFGQRSLENAYVYI